MSLYHITKQKFALVFLMLFFAGITTNAQQVKRPQPVWWFGESGAANFNTYRGTTQMLNSSLTTPTAFHKGKGVKPYVSLLTEYRPNRVWGGMLNVAYDNRGGKFNQVIAPCNCPADLSANIGYVTVEPSLRVAPFSNGFYIYAGPTLSFNVTKRFTYTQEKQTDVRSDWSDVRKTVFSAQAGAGVDIPLSSKLSATQMSLSPFVSFLTDFGHDPRSVESWSVYTIRAGMAFKFGTAKIAAPAATVAAPVTLPAATAVKEVQFTVRAPKVVPLNRQVKETFPLRNSVFFDMGSTDVPKRYVTLSVTEATAFKEAQLQQSQPGNLNNGRSARQMAVYHNILNIMGDRLRSNPQSSITLTGASDKNPVEGKMLAENIKYYLVTVFGIEQSRIITVGRDKPVIPSEQPGGVNELALLHEGDRRVDIESNSAELLLQVGGSTSPFLKPVQFETVQSDPLDSHVIFSAEGASESLESWTIEVTDERGNKQHYGPYTGEQASVPGKTILGDNPRATILF